MCGALDATVVVGILPLYSFSWPCDTQIGSSDDSFICGPQDVGEPSGVL